MENGSSNYSSAAVTSHIGNVRTMNESTAYQYLSRLKDFEAFIRNKYGLTVVDRLVPEIKKGQQDIYDILNSYAAHLKSCNISRLTLKQRIVTVKNFFEYYDIEISDRRFKLKLSCTSSTWTKIFSG